MKRQMSSIIEIEFFEKSINLELSPLDYKFVNNSVTSQLLGADTPLNVLIRFNH